ncbi:TPA: hypothetical protein I7793_21645, partial [Vibrio vulnificus]|nr:hypothetical protein [Vibrio vulnificus]
NLGSLFTRHFEYNEVRKQIGVSIYNPDVAERHSFYVSILSVQLIDAGIRIVSSLDPKLKPEFDSLKQHFDEQYLAINT